MNANTLKLVLIPVLLFSSLMISATSHAFRGGVGGNDFRGAGDGFHQNNDVFNNRNTNIVDVNRNNDFVGGYHNNNYWGATVAVPVVGYYSSQCQTVQVCDSSGQCALQNSCDQ